MGLLLQPDSVLMEPRSGGRDRGSGGSGGRGRVRCGGRVVVFRGRLWAKPGVQWVLGAETLSGACACWWDSSRRLEGWRARWVVTGGQSGPPGQVLQTGAQMTGIHLLTACRLDFQDHGVCRAGSSRGHPSVPGPDLLLVRTRSSGGNTHPGDLI